MRIAAGGLEERLVPRNIAAVRGTAVYAARDMGTDLLKDLLVRAVCVFPDPAAHAGRAEVPAAARNACRRQKRLVFGLVIPHVELEVDVAAGRAHVVHPLVDERLVDDATLLEAVVAVGRRVGGRRLTAVVTTLVAALLGGGAFGDVAEEGNRTEDREDPHYGRTKDEPRTPVRHCTLLFVVRHRCHLAYSFL